MSSGLLPKRCGGILSVCERAALLHCVSYTSLGRTSTVPCDCSSAAGQESPLNREHIAVSLRSQDKRGGPGRAFTSPRSAACLAIIKSIMTHDLEGGCWTQQSSGARPEE